mmetsp:Transcript_18273/g.18349  ORF Transcript_18273/g.18349 Transcript_18273/m.18349 type:complete len:203 (+) Transcript_18273:100-708(+)|eukprot:CAMPEP_0182427826 /NCGR_PEP_ID=MMETSP1167-20130531/20099_1 /TAXON_ID=2988 /ORGANISM="Mallomonas Sp, Strain CCMP3275" /LENGTH=202 /DNA_ID=CAMNT_0024610357 /DNA_START=63 /DNA_END=671 /DNA_ORIENTATION=+
MRIIIILGFSLLSSWGFVSNRRVVHVNPLHSILRARVAKQEEETTKEKVDDDDDMIQVPFTGLVSQDGGGVFDKPVDVFDPTKDTDDLPGADGSDEKIAAIQKRIQDRVAELKKAGEWEMSNEEFGRNPLASISLFDTMIYQIQNCKPFESYGELGLTYGLVITTSSFILTYLLALKLAFEAWIQWFVSTDFDFLSSIIRSG